MNNSQYREYQRECALERKMMWMIAIGVALIFGLAYVMILLQAMGVWIH